jgi:uncharacterized protein (TIGR02594 family)
MSDNIPKWLEIASHELGVSEIVGLDHNKRILQYHSETSLKATSDEIPWCSSFVNWVMKQSMIKGTYSAAARSWLNWGYESASLVNGCIVVLKRGNDEKSGHVGFLVGHDESFVHILGGNQSNKVCVQKYARHDVLGYRWPFKVIG